MLKNLDRLTILGYCLGAMEILAILNNFVNYFHPADLMLL